MILPKKKKRKLATLPKNGVWYYAYGSNLSITQMHARCPGAIQIKDLSLAYGRLVFRGVADCLVTDDENDIIHGGLWYISQRHESILDGVEGVRSKFYLKRYIKLQVDGVPVNAMFYLMNPKLEGLASGVMPPGPRYLDTIVQGYRDFGLPLEALNNALAEAWDNKNVTPLLARRKLQRNEKLARRIRNMESVQ